MRYKYDEENNQRYTTVEIIVENGEWEQKKKLQTPERTLTDRYGVQVAGYELEIRDQVKKAGGIWRPRQKLWELPYGQILALGLEERIVDGIE